MPIKKFYAYLIDGESGITGNWPDCQKIVSGKPDAKYKGFLTREEAKRWLEAGADYDIKHIAGKKGIYFDAGTGAGLGVEVNVTDERGEPLLEKTLLKNNTNNFGELLACKYALELAIKKGVKKVFGDSNLVLESWSKGFIKLKDKSPELINLVAEVAGLRKDFEKSGGKIQYIPGASNPADLGFHK